MRHIYFFGIFIIVNCKSFELKLTTSDQILREVEIYKGHKAVLVNVWATWCKPCIEEFPMIIDLEKSEKNLKVIFVNTDFLDNKIDVENFLIEQGLEKFSFIKNQKDQSFIDGLHEEWTGALPFTILFAKNTGKVVDYWEGKRAKKEFEEAIKKSIKM